LINEYLDEAHPAPPLMPDEPAERHEVRRWSKWIDDVCLPAVQKPNWSRSMRPLAAAWSDEELERRLAAVPTEARRQLWRRMARDPFRPEEIEAALDVLEGMTVEIERYLERCRGPWLFGQRLTLADLNAAPYVIRFEEERPGRLKPLTAAWWSRLTARPAWAVAELGGYAEDSARTEAEAMADPA
jgi:glutathione S-transferase